MNGTVLLKSLFQKRKEGGEIYAYFFQVMREKKEEEKLEAVGRDMI